MLLGKSNCGGFGELKKFIWGFLFYVFIIVRVEQEVFSCQRTDVMTLRNELKHLSNVAAQLEPYIRSLTPAQQQSEAHNEQAQHLQQLLEHIGKLRPLKSKQFKKIRLRSFRYSPTV